MPTVAAMSAAPMIPTVCLVTPINSVACRLPRSRSGTVWKQSSSCDSPITGTMEYIAGCRSASLNLDVRGADHLAPCLYFSLDALREFLRRARNRVAAKRHQTLLHVRQREDFGDLAIEQSDDFLRCSGRD